MRLRFRDFLYFGGIFEHIDGIPKIKLNKVDWLAVE